MKLPWTCPRCEKDNVIKKKTHAVVCSKCNFSFFFEVVELIKAQAVFETWLLVMFKRVQKHQLRKKENWAYGDPAVASIFLAFSGGMETKEKMWAKMTGLRKMTGPIQ